MNPFARPYRFLKTETVKPRSPMNSNDLLPDRKKIKKRRTS